MKELEGFESLCDAFGNIAQTLPGKELTKAVKKGAPMVQKAIMTAAPKKTGTLRGGIILHRERNRQKGKVVYDIMMDPEKNAVFQKLIENPVRSKTPYAYYPASQEYGFFTRRSDGGMTYTRASGDKISLDKVPGKHFMRVGAEVTGETAKNAIAGSLLESIEKELGGGNGK